MTTRDKRELVIRFVVLLAIVPSMVSCESDPQPSEGSELEQAAYELQQLQNGVELPAVHFRKHDRSLIDRMAWFREAIDEYFHERGETLQVAGASIRVPCREDLICMKLLAGRPQDLQDAEAMARAGTVGSWPHFAETEMHRNRTCPRRSRAPLRF